MIACMIFFPMLYSRKGCSVVLIEIKNVAITRSYFHPAFFHSGAVYKTQKTRKTILLQLKTQHSMLNVNINGFKHQLMYEVFM